MRVLALLLCLVAARAQGAPPALLVLGDSLSAAYGIRVEEGWVALLATRLASSGYGYRVVNASVSGETSSGALARLPHLLERERPALVLVEIGANDGLRGLPVAELEAHLAGIVRAARAGGARVLLIGIRLPPNYGPVYGEDFAAAYARLAREQKLPFLPFLLEPIANDPDAFQADGLHPTAAAEPRVLEHVWPALAPLLAPGTPAPLR
jgi:acyl-CoA thioesterase I